MMASEGSCNGSASGEIIVHFGVFLNSKIKIRGKASDSGERQLGRGVREGGDNRWDVSMERFFSLRKDERNVVRLLTMQQRGRGRGDKRSTDL